ncbi:DNA-3-methyladenine glycosylase I [Rathayibacter rathayi]|uniref:DNA-3-methyladenine glycosylase I n=1 Tax=Rathayibacter rathayi TaxID=33887 RepID=UPI000BCD3AD6|nr:DNA-3-methyladenine glycosylase I [Rathayibacter rathayi]AZZ49168.1 DNA-3-methyladenine glycosylase I [Rathayibacter rathayi]MWV73227.1 DNA-3-methyladenine glycosylase I [Rathayibacter rathayi NCPPB 2980 = VKM Ac-1601]PPF51891.1 DNA-3-methyladenine glycosylase I [Rathayibacter rathayi]PPG47318.1 DNA-3-methyladenine glycosylase I [Rathayibacter rathayi]PPG71966.1 DNA-3-methyladenine glycosylase I [Rathayibacter rathayi]
MSVGDGLTRGDDSLLRCAWSGTDAEYRRYHDEEWGTPLHGDRALFEKISLEAFQSGLSWITILRKRPRFREVFAGFDPALVARFDDDDIERLMEDTGIIRNRAKITATRDNARSVLAFVEQEGAGALDRLVWSFHDPAQAHRVIGVKDVPATTPESVALARALKGIGLRFVGPTTAYALMQSAGVVDDHLTGCWRRL